LRKQKQAKRYSGSPIGVMGTNAAKWLFPQEKATLLTV
jgi:hypothetical protein